MYQFFFHDYSLFEYFALFICFIFCCKLIGTRLFFTHLLLHINSLQFKRFLTYYIISLFVKYAKMKIRMILSSMYKIQFIINFPPYNSNKFPLARIIPSFFFFFSFLLQLAISNMEARVVPVTRFPPLPRVPRCREV